MRSVLSVDQRSEPLPAAQPDERNASIGSTLYLSEPCARCGNHTLTGLANVIQIRSIIHSHTARANTSFQRKASFDEHVSLPGRMDNV